MNGPNDNLPYVTPITSTISGEVRRTPEDFQVDEIPSYTPCGHGEHLFVHFRKTGLNTPEAVRRLARALGTKPGGSSWAGLKDRNAVTSQWASFQGGDPARAATVELEGIAVLDAKMHTHKLRTGQLRGNRFRIRIRDVSENAGETARELLEQLDRMGVPNYYGAQRFGRDGHNLIQARRWIVDGLPAPADLFFRKLYFSAMQAAMFNDWLAHRLRIGPIDSPVQGDLMRKEDTGGIFLCDDLAAADTRIKRWEISPTGPVFGARMRSPEHRAREMEEATLKAWSISFDTLRRFRRFGSGSRRALRFRALECTLVPESSTLTVSFRLPKGAYATMVLRELMKGDSWISTSSNG